MLVGYGVRQADEAGLECFSACTTQANKNMQTILRKAGFQIVTSEPVKHGRGLCVHGGYRKANAETSYWYDERLSTKPTTMP